MKGTDQIVHKGFSYIYIYICIFYFLYSFLNAFICMVGAAFIWMILGSGFRVQGLGLRV